MFCGFCYRFLLDTFVRRNERAVYGCAFRTPARRVSRPRKARAHDSKSESPPAQNKPQRACNKHEDPSRAVHMPERQEQEEIIASARARDQNENDPRMYVHALRELLCTAVQAKGERSKNPGARLVLLSVCLSGTRLPPEMHKLVILLISLKLAVFWQPSMYCRSSRARFLAPSCRSLHRVHERHFVFWPLSSTPQFCTQNKR